MSQDRLAKYTAVITDGSLANSAGEALSIDLNVPLGQAARVTRVWPLGFHLGGTVNGDATIGLSLDPSEPAPVSVLSVYQNTDVVETWDYIHQFTSSGAAWLSANFGVNVDLLVARNLSCVAFNASGGNILNWGMKILFNLVTLSISEMADVLARQR